MYLLTVFLVLCCLAELFIGYPIVIDISNDRTSPSENGMYKIGDTVNPFAKFNFDKGKWIAYLIISKNDKRDLQDGVWVGKFKTDDKMLLKQMQNNLRFIYYGGDMATVESKMILYNDGNRFFESGIVLDKSMQGLQQKNWGWLQVNSQNNLAYYCKRFQRIYSPIIVLR
jgi:hypothetical protein